ncbi:MAG: DUF433 domain-containing protein [Tepidiformaceae bacterium]
MTATVDIGTLIVSTPGTVGGRPRIANTRISVATIAIWTKQGYSPEDIVENIGGVGLAGIHAALAYYFANREAIDEWIAAEEVAFDAALKEQASSGRLPASLLDALSA